jgi:hypothetical protein
MQPVGYETPPPAKKRNVWLWVLGGCGGITLLSLVVGGVALYLGYRAVDEVSKNPIRTAAKIIELTNPDIEVVAVDEEKELVTFRDKKTGTTATVSLKELEQKAKSGDGTSSPGPSAGSQPSSSPPEVGSGDKDNLPDWVPVYPGAKVAAKVTSGSGSKGTGSLTLMTKDRPETVFSFYETKLGSLGFSITRVTTGSYRTINAKRPSGENLTVMVMKVESDDRREDDRTEDDDDSTSIALTYNVGK